MLDLCISYKDLKQDYGDNLMLFDHLNDLKTQLFSYFNEHYPTLTPLSLPFTPVQASSLDGLLQKSFIAWYHQKMKYSANELEEYFKLFAKDFHSCNPIQWWVSCQSQFLHLFQMVHDSLCIPS